MFYIKWMGEAPHRGDHSVLLIKESRGGQHLLQIKSHCLIEDQPVKIKGDR